MNYFGTQNLQLYDWYVTSADLTQWIDYLSELDSIHIGCETWNWIPYILDMLLEIGFPKKKRTLEK